MKTPLLLIGDGPHEPTGLGRILRDLASRIRETFGDQIDFLTVICRGTGRMPSLGPLPLRQAAEPPTWWEEQYRQFEDAIGRYDAKGQ